MPEVLWVYRITKKTAIGHTPFTLTYGYEAMIPLVLTPPSHQRLTYDQQANHQLLDESLDGIEEIRERSKLRKAVYQQRVGMFYNSKVKDKKLKPGDMVSQQVFLNTKDASVRVLGPNWEGPYVVTEALKPQTYKLAHYDYNLNPVPVPRYWNGVHL
uniref:Reverse transcriptase domain-containing protein n=1 Tax=Cannabis sativa TaxID=3483 RepID=A0A803P9W2_CANSA